MASNFNPQILVEKLSKLNMSQQSIETLSHWCIFHMNKAKQVVETWDKQFHCSPREQRVAFLYLANDILQNSRRKGVEFVTEFWKVLPDSLRDVIENGDEFGKKAALRLVNIWEERKVFGSRGQLLKIELEKRPQENGNRHARTANGLDLKSPGGMVLDRIVTGYQSVYCSQLDEEAILNKCRTAISFVQKVEKDFGGDYRLGHVNSSITDELKGQSVVLRDSIDQLKTVDCARASLITLLREALQEQENKRDQVRDQVQAAQMNSEQANHIFQQLQLLGGSNVNGNMTPASQAPQSLTSGEQQQQPSTVVYTRQVSAGPEISSHVEKDAKMEAAAVAAKLMAATSSAQMVNFVLSSLASGLNPVNESSSDYPPEKKAKVDEGQQSSHTPTENHPVPPPEEPNPEEHPPPPPSSPPPPLPPLPQPLRPYQVPQYTHVYSVPYTYNMPQPQLVAAPINNYGAPVAGLPNPMAGVSQYPPLPPNIYQGYPGEGGYYTSHP